LAFFFSGGIAVRISPSDQQVKIIANAGVAFGSMFQNIDTNLLLTKAVYLEYLNSRKKKYFVGLDFWEQAK
jgi:hypothetical protein